MKRKLMSIISLAACAAVAGGAAACGQDEEAAKGERITAEQYTACTSVSAFSNAKASLEEIVTRNDVQTSRTTMIYKTDGGSLYHDITRTNDENTTFRAYTVMEESDGTYYFNWDNTNNCWNAVSQENYHGNESIEELLDDFFPPFDTLSFDEKTGKYIYSKEHAEDNTSEYVELTFKGGKCRSVYMVYTETSTPAGEQVVKVTKTTLGFTYGGQTVIAPTDKLEA